jgi:transposase
MRRLSLRKIREVLRLHSALGCTHRQIASACHISPSTVGAYIERAVDAGLTWAEAEPLSEAAVEARLFTYVGRSEPKARATIDFDWIHGELSRPGVTLQLLWGEYQVATREAQAAPYQYSQFCELYATWRNQRRLSMRQTHRPGEKLFIDYSGKKPCFIDAETGEVHEVELFVVVLGASNYTFAEVTLSQTIPDFTASIVRALEYFGAVPTILVPDQLRSAVCRPTIAATEIASAWLAAFRRQDMESMLAQTRYPFELRDTGIAGRPGSQEARRTAASAEEMPAAIGPLFTDTVLDRTMKAERDGRVEVRAGIPYWADRWRADLQSGMQMREAYFRADDASFSFLFFVDESGVRALWKNGFDASLEVELAGSWLNALRQRDLDALERLTSYPFELRDTEVEAHCGLRRAAGPKEMPGIVDCLLNGPILSKAMNRIRSRIEAGRTQDYEPGIFKGWRRPEHANLWPATLLIGTGAGNEYDLTFLVAKNGVRVLWKRGSFVPPD